MLGIHDLGLFVLAGLLLNITPGADTLYIVGRAAAQGLRAGLLAALGIGAGCLVHVIASALGLSALLTTSATAFTVIKLIGAAYLLYLGLSLLFTNTKRTESIPSVPSVSLSKVFWGGFLTNVLNPKVALFFLAFLPQFISPETPAKLLSMLFLGVVFTTNGTLWNLLMAWTSVSVTAKFKATHHLKNWLKRTCGVIFIYFGVKLLRTQT